MSWVSNSIETSYDLEEARALFTEGMSSQEKQKIYSAMQAIAPQRRQEVSEITQQIVLGGRCHAGRENLIPVIATKNLSPDEWSKIVSAASCVDCGLSEGGEIAQVLLAVAELPTAKRTFCNQIQRWIDEKTPVQDRVVLLRALPSIRNMEELDYAAELVEGLQTGQEIASVLRAIGRASPSEGSNSFLRYTETLIKPSMTAEERVQKIEEAEVSGWYNSLKSNSWSIADQLLLKRAYEALPDPKDHLDFQTSMLVTESMSLEEVLPLLHAAAMIPCEEREDVIPEIRSLGLIGDETNVEDRIRALQAFQSIRPENRKAISTYTFWFYPLEIPAKDRFQILNALIALPQRRLTLIYNFISSLITDSMDLETRLKFLHAILPFQPEEQPQIFNHSKGLITIGMNAEDKLEILHAIAAFPPGEQVEILIFSRQLITPEMNAEDRLKILHAIAALPHEKREGIVHYSKALITPVMNAEDIERILIAIGAIPPEDLEAICSSVIGLIKDDTNSEDRVKLLNAVTALPSLELEAYLDHAESFFDDLMSVDDKVAILNEVGQISSEMLQIHTLTRSLLDPDMSVEDMAKLQNAVANLPVEHREVFFESANSLFTDSMSVDDKVAILNAIAELPHDDLESIENCLHRLVYEAMTANARIRILNAVRVLGPDDRDEIFIDNIEELNATSIIRLINHPEERDAHNAGLIFAAPNNPHARSGEGGMTIEEFLRVEEAFDGGAAAIEYSLTNILGEPVKRLCIDLSKLSQNPIEVLSKLSEYIETNHAFPSIRFWNAEEGISQGIDAGGLTREFITRLFQALTPKADDARILLPMKSEGNLSLPMVADNSPISIQNQIKYYTTLGVIYALALRGVDNFVVRTGPLFQPVVFQMIHHLKADNIDQIPLQLSRAQDIPEEIYKRELKNFLSIRWPLLFSNDAAIDAFITNGTVTEQMRASWGGEDLTKEDVMATLEFDKMIVPVLVMAKSMKQNGVDWDAIGAKSAADLEANIQGKVTREIAKATIADDHHDLTEAKQQKKEFLIRYIDECTQEELEKLCIAACGSPVLHPLMITSADAGPGFHTCFRSIDLPICANYEDFKAVLSAGIALAQDGRYSQG